MCSLYAFAGGKGKKKKEKEKKVKPFMLYSALEGLNHNEAYADLHFSCTTFFPYS